MAVTLETIHREIKQVRRELHRLLSMLDDETDITNEAPQKLKNAREEMAKGKFVSHSDVIARYG